MLKIKFLSVFLLVGVFFLNSDTNNAQLNELKLTSTFGDNRTDHFHTGIDIAAANNGIVTFHKSEEVVFYSIERPGSIRYGNGEFIITKSEPDHYITNYSHIQAGSFDRSRLSYKQGEVIGSIGNTGRSTGPHLHIEIYDLKNSQLINPLSIINFADTSNPVINDVYFIKDNNERVSLIGGGGTVENGGKLFISCYDRIQNSQYQLTPYSIFFSIDGEEKGGVRLDRLIPQGSSYSIAGANISFDRLYRNGANFDYYIGEFYSLPLTRGLKIVVSDYNGNIIEFKRPLRFTVKRSSR